MRNTITHVAYHSPLQHFATLSASQTLQHVIMEEALPPVELPAIAPPPAITSATQLMGNTPILKMTRREDEKADIFAKLECRNLMSNKDRPVLSMVQQAIAEGKISRKTEVVEASSGNTAISLAILGTTMGFPVRIYMHEKCSMERRQILCAYGATVVITPAAEQTAGARKRGMKYCEENPQTTFFLNQHSNPNNGRAHFLNHGPEIYKQVADAEKTLGTGPLGAVVIGLGTSGTFDGLTKYFKTEAPTPVRVIGFEPKGSPVYSGGEKGPHRIVGIGPGFITPNFKNAVAPPDEIVLVEDDAAFEATQGIAKQEGMLVGVTAGAGLHVARQLARRDEYAGMSIVCIFCDTGERYLSVPQLFEANVERMD